MTVDATPVILLVGGVVIACSAGALGYLWQTTGGRLRRIRTLNADLEDRFAERTRQLVAANATLEGTVRHEREAAARLLEQERELEQIFDAGRIGIWTLDLRSAAVVGHGRLPELYGLRPTDAPISLEAFRAAVHPDDRGWVAQLNAEVIAGERPELAMEFRVVWPDHTTHWLFARGQLVRDADGTPLRLTGINVDITTRKNAQLAVEASVLEFRQLADAMPQIVWTSTPDGRLDYSNQRWYDYTGLTFAETKDFGWRLALHPDDLQNCIERWTHSFTTGEPYQIEYRFKRASDGAYRWHLGRASPIRSAAGAILRWFGTSTDIEDDKQADANVRALNETLELRVAERTLELAGANLEISQTRAQLQGVLNAATEMSIIATDPAGIIRVFNAGAERMLQYRADEMVGLRTPEILHDPAELLERAGELSLERGRQVGGFGAFVEARQRPVDERQWTYVRKDRSRLDVNVIVTAVRSPAGVIEGYLGIATDITVRKRLEAEARLHNEQLAEQTRRAEEANRAKSEFLATMSHEIRTPMNGVVGMTEVLLLTELSKEQRGYAELVLGSADSLLTVIDDILDFSKVESGRMRLETIDFVLRTAIEEVADLLAERAQSKGVEMACLIQHDIPSVVRGDPGRLRQILTNLLGNAIKFTAAGEVVLRARLAQDGGDEVTIRFEVSDTGIGISPEGRSRLFQSFSQADSSTTRKFGGSGLGLAISKRLCELMDGEMGVQSEPGKGSTFWFTVKLKKIPATQIVLTTPREDLREVFALVVDDNQTNQQLVRAQARGWGMACDAASHGSEALAMINAAAGERPYDVVILDMQMPGMDGFELAQAIKGDPSNDRVKLVLMTSMAQRGHGARSAEVGIAAFLTKPVRQSQLYDCLRTVLAPSGEASPEEVHPTIKMVTAHSLREAKDLRRPRVLLAEDNQTNQMAAVRMLELLGYQVDVAVNGIEAVAAYRAIDYGIVLMDNQMPEMDGLSATREIRTVELAHGKLPVPIIALTANAMQGDREKCLAAGMNDYLSKPFNVVQLTGMLERWARVSPSIALATADAARPVPGESAIDSSVLDGLRDLGVDDDDNDFVSTIIEQYRVDSASRMVALKEAAACRDAIVSKFVAHSLKGSSSAVGANRMAAICGAFEERACHAMFDGAPDLIAALDDECRRVYQALAAATAR